MSKMRNSGPKTLFRKRVLLPHHEYQSADIGIPHIGKFEPVIDRVKITTSISKPILLKRLPMDQLHAVSHYFKIRDHPHPKPGIQSIIEFTCTSDAATLDFLYAHEARLGFYKITSVEAAFDIGSENFEHCAEGWGFLATHILKLRQYRREVILIGEYEPLKKPIDTGCLQLPSMYFEPRSSSIGLKIYGRLEKLPRGKYGDPRARLEWNFSRGSIVRHIGGNQLGDLIRFDQNAFLEKNLRLETFDLIELGKLVFPKTIGDDYRAWRAAHLFLRIQAYSTPVITQDRDLWELFSRQGSAFTMCRLRELRDGVRKKKKGRPKKADWGRYRITNHRIKKCIKPVKLRKHL